MERRSPTAAALLSATMARGTALSFQSESDLATIARNRAQSASKAEAAQWPGAEAADLKRDQDGLFIFNLSSKFPAGLQIAHAHHLARQAIFQHLHFEHHLQRPILHEGIDKLAPADGRSQSNGAVGDWRSSGHALRQLHERFRAPVVRQQIAPDQRVAALADQVGFA